MNRIILSVLTMSALLCGCQKDQVSDVSRKQGIIQATIEDISATRTVMDENNNIRWSEGDQIVGFMKSTLGVKYQVSAASVGKTSASFEEVSSGGLNAGTELEHIIAYYPYSSSVSAAKSGSNYTLDVILPTEQTYVAESFGHGAMPMVAVSETNNITFRNICGGMKLQLKGTQKVVSIKVEGKNDELLSGAATVTAYTDETKPAITMTSGASTSVTLDCGSGVQLNESTATEFILVMPPVLFSKGFTVTVTDSDSQTYTIETDKANTVFRSSLLVMPIAKLNTSGGEDSGDNEELIIPVSNVELNYTSLKLYEMDTAQLLATVKPIDATNKSVVWFSDDTTVVKIDQTGFLTCLSEGSAKISAVADGVIATCYITVLAYGVAATDYVDEYGLNHGKGIVIGTIVWAPVNCGYHKDDYIYGKLYQWGRKYGQGYDGSLYDVDMNEIGTYSDAIIPIIDDGGISEISGQHSKNSNVYYAGNSDSDYDWVYPPNPDLWNSGTESSPIKADGDPCPSGWRVPTASELDILSIHRSSMVSKDGMNGYWFSGEKEYTEDAPRVFLCAAGRRETQAVDRGKYCFYWSSTSHPGYYYGLAYHMGTMGNSNYMHKHMFLSERDAARSVRCVQE